jgi:hypothetical protein
MDVSVSDSNPVTRQKVLLQVWCLSDNSPMRYSWQAESGDLQAWDENQEFAYWIAPEAPTTSRITCTITDDEDNSAVHVFEIPVSERSIEPVLGEDTVASLEKQRVSLLGGAWVSTRDSAVRYVSSSRNEATTWTGTFGTMHIDMYNLSYTLWGAPVEGNEISVQSSSGESILVCEDCAADEAIHDLAIDVMDSYLLWIAAEEGLHWYNSTSDTHGTYEEGAISETYALFSGQEFVYAATSSGIFTLDGEDDDTPLYPGNSRAVLEIVGDDATTPDTVEADDSRTVWHITDGIVYRNDQALVPQPPAGDASYSLDVDLDGSIWRGKYRWNGSSWQSPAGLDDVEVVKSVASNEGLIYFQTASGALLRW